MTAVPTRGSRDRTGHQDGDPSVRERWDSTQATIRERIEDLPVTRVAKRTIASFPVRMWRRFLQRNGFLLAAGISYQALFAMSAAIYVVFASVGLWLGGSQEAVDGLIDLINGYIPGLISDEGLISRSEVQGIASGTTGVLSVTGAFALTVAAWTAIGAVTFSRRAVREIFGLKPDLRSYVMLKARDLLAAVLFGIALLLGGALSAFGTWALGSIAGLLGWELAAPWAGGALRTASIAVSFLLNCVVLAALFAYLTGTTLQLRRVIPGSLVGSTGLTALQVGAGVLLVYTPSNPLLATFALFIGLLLWFRLVGLVVLVAASWVATSAEDDDAPILPSSRDQQLEEEHAALLLAARVRVRTATEAAEGAPWYRRWGARRAVSRARTELEHVEASPPTERRRGSLFD